jgi:hypothetical protein
MSIGEGHLMDKYKVISFEEYRKQKAGNAYRKDISQNSLSVIITLLGLLTLASYT